MDARELEALRAALEGERKRNALFQSEIDAIRRVRSMIEFELDGTIRFANGNFLKQLEYQLEDVKGKHHSMLVSAAYRASAEYQDLWAKLARGEHQAGEYLCISKTGKEVWLQGYYAPMLDASGKPVAVISYATNVTAQVLMSRQLQATVEQTQSAVKAALGGDLSQRISLEGKSGHVEALSRGVNALFDTIGAVVDEVNVVVECARQRVRELLGKADTALAIFGARADVLRAAARFVAERKN